MKKLFPLFVCACLSACIFMSPSCKKIYHSTNPTPSNFRLLGFTKVTTRNSVVPLKLWPAITETYSFGYNSDNKLSEILYVTNDSNQKKADLLDLRMEFTYSAGSVYRNVYNVNSAKLLERDTFSLNGYGQVTNANFPFESHSYAYQGVLLASETDVYSDSGTTVSATSYFTSDNHDLLHQLFNGTLTASFPDSGIRPDINALDTFRDSILTYPITVSWSNVIPVVTGYDTATVTHTVGSNTDALNNYSQNLLELNAVDGNGIYVRPVFFPAGLSTSKFFQIYDFLTNRTGDYLQLESFKTCGVNIYQNAHLLKQLTTSYDTTFVSYDIDGQSKVTQTHVKIKDKLGNTTLIEYKLQYDTN